MRKSKTYNETRFALDALAKALVAVRSVADNNDLRFLIEDYSVQFDDVQWQYDTVDEFLSNLGETQAYGLRLRGHGICLGVDYYSSGYTAISVEAPLEKDIASVFRVFEEHRESAQLPHRAANIFIGHGRSTAWRDLKDHLQDKHGLTVLAYETGPRGGLD